MPRPTQGNGGRVSTRRPRPSHHRRSNGPSTRTPSTRNRVSELETLLDAAAAQTAPQPRDFAQLGLPDALVTTLARRGFTMPFAIQTRALPDALAGRDVLGRAQTGSGKTLAFGLAVLARLHACALLRTASAPRGLILASPRELAHQAPEE